MAVSHTPGLLDHELGNIPERTLMGRLLYHHAWKHRAFVSARRMQDRKHRSSEGKECLIALSWPSTFLWAIEGLCQDGALAVMV